MGDRVGPVGTGEASSSQGATTGMQRLSPVNWSMVLDRQEALVRIINFRIWSSYYLFKICNLTFSCSLLEVIYIREALVKSRPAFKSTQTVLSFFSELK